MVKFDSQTKQFYVCNVFYVYSFYEYDKHHDNYLNQVKLLYNILNIYGILITLQIK